MSARNGGHLMIPFQCDLCYYYNLKGMNPVGVKDGVTLLRTIRRANLQG